MDDLGSTIVVGATLAFTALLLGMAQRGQAPRNESTGALEYRFGPMLRGLAYVTIFLIPTAVIILIFVQPPKKASDYWIAAALFGGFLALGGPLLWETKRYAMFASDDGLDCRSAWRKARFLKWNEVNKISYSLGNSWFIIHATDGWKFRISVYIAGLNQFLELCERHLTPKHLEEAKFGYNAVARQFPTTAKPKSGPPPTR